MGSDQMRPVYTINVTQMHVTHIENVKYHNRSIIIPEIFNIIRWP